MHTFLQRVTEIARFIALEGPAGVGKTAIANALALALRDQGFSVALCAEFSDSPLGQALRIAADRCLGKQPMWMLGIGGVMAFLSDHLHHVESCAAQETQITVLDRGLWTQSILGLRALPLLRDYEAMSIILGILAEWLHQRFSPRSLVVFLTAHPSVLMQRLEHRCQRPLSKDEISLLNAEREAYERLSYQPLGWPVHRIDCSDQELDCIVQRITRRVLGAG